MRRTPPLNAPHSRSNGASAALRATQAPYWVVFDTAALQARFRTKLVSREYSTIRPTTTKLTRMRIHRGPRRGLDLPLRSTGRRREGGRRWRHYRLCHARTNGANRTHAVISWRESSVLPPRRPRRASFGYKPNRLTKPKRGRKGFAVTYQSWAELARGRHTNRVSAMTAFGAASRG